MVGAKALRQGWVCCDFETAQRPVRLRRIKERREIAGPDHAGSVHVCEDFVVTLSVMGTHWRALKESGTQSYFSSKTITRFDSSVKDRLSKGRAEAESSGKRLF